MKQPEAIRARYHAVRAATELLAGPLSAEDQQLQSMPTASPTKWHRGHTTWFFETFVLAPAGFSPWDERFGVLFNSYYEAVGPRHPRPARGLLSRPTCDEVSAWRRAVDARMDTLLARLDDPAVVAVVELGLAHEEQHQELILTDILHAFSQSPLRPVYRGSSNPSWGGGFPPATPPGTERPSEPARWLAIEGGPVGIGASDGFAFDNERPRHTAWLEPYEIFSRPVTVAEARAFVAERGYHTPSLWSSDGLDWARANGIEAPGYVTVEEGTWWVFGLDGERVLADDEPAAHLSWYEADAIARFLGARLPTEAEWGHAAAGAPVEGNFRESGALRPLPARGTRLYGDVWQWTSSAHAPHPGYRRPAGALGEYTGKFMVNQLVLKGGSCFSPPGHLRASYRNFWAPDTRFQVTGLRLARDRQ